MSPDRIFSVANMLALGCWILLAALPSKPWVSKRLAGAVVPGVLAAVYAAIVAVHFAGSDGGFSTLQDVSRLFANPWMLLAGWIHYLVFDLLVGVWETRDARERGIRHVFLIPCLIVTFLFGPAGWLLYLGMRSVSARPAAA